MTTASPAPGLAPLDPDSPDAAALAARLSAVFADVRDGIAARRTTGEKQPA